MWSRLKPIQNLLYMNINRALTNLVQELNRAGIFFLLLEVKKLLISQFIHEEHTIWLLLEVRGVVCVPFCFFCYRVPRGQTMNGAPGYRFRCSWRLEVTRGCSSVRRSSRGVWGVTGALVSGIMWITAATARGANAHRQD